MTENKNQEKKDLVINDDGETKKINIDDLEEKNLESTQDNSDDKGDEIIVVESKSQGDKFLKEESHNKEDKKKEAEGLENDEEGADNQEEILIVEDLGNIEDYHQINNETSESSYKDNSFKRALGKLVNFLFNTIFTLLLMAILLGLVTSLSSYALGTYPSIMGYSLMIIGEDSMSPTLNREDAIIVKEIDPKEVVAGDLVVYESAKGSDLITSWVTQTFPEERFEVKKKIQEEHSVVIDGIALVGVGVYYLEGLGGFIKFATHPVGIAAFLIVLIIIYLIMWISSSRKNKNNKD